MSNSPKGFKPGRDPWCWQSKTALRLIREALDAENAVSSGLLVYFALTEIASDKQSQTFQTTHGYIAGRTGLSQRTVQQRIHDLTEIGVLQYKVEPGVRGPATYTLTDEQPLPHVKQPTPNDEQPLPHVKQRAQNAPLPSLEESSEESSKNKTKNLNKSGSLNVPKAADGEKLAYLWDQCKTVLGDVELKRPDCHRRWYDRARSQPEKLQRVLADTRNKVNEDGLENPAAWAEAQWKEFKA